MERKLEYLKGLGIDVLLLDSIFDKDLRIEARYSSAQASQAGPESVLSQLLTKTRGRGIKLIADSSVAGLPDPGDALIGFAAELVSRSSGLNGFRLPASRAASRDGSYYQRFIEALKKSNPEAVAMSPSGSEGGPAMAGFDLVSSPKTFLEPLSRYLTGLAPGDPKPSGYNDAAAFAAAIAAAQLKLPQNAVLCSALSLDEPELPRLSTRLMERAEAKADDAKDGEAAWLGAYREALVLQMTMPGSPLSLYGAETALEGGKGNDSLRGFPWGAENRELIGLCRDLAGLRKTMPALRSGSYLALAADASGFFAFTRWDGKSRAIVLANNAAERRLFSLQAAKAGLADGDRVKTVLASSEAGHLKSGTTYQIKDNLLSVSLPPHGCLIMSASISHEDPPSPEKGPSLLRSFPTDKAKELAADTRIIMEFSEEMEQDSVLDSFRIEPEMPGSFVWNGNTCTFVPEKGFEAKTRYTVSLGSGLRARKGGFSMKMGKSITFTTH
jgi:alpha-glucosidase